MNLLFLLLALWIGYLAAEALRLSRWQKAVPLRITVTGTRGKTSTAKMMASVLRAHPGPSRGSGRPGGALGSALPAGRG